MNQRWEAYPFGGFLLLSLFAFFTPGEALPAGPDVSDKIEHAAIFAVLALTGRFAGYAEQRLLAGLVAYAVATEILQAVLPISRMGDVRDVIADCAGVVAGLLLARLIARGVERYAESRSDRLRRD